MMAALADEPRPPVCDYEGSDYQRRFWQQADRAYEDRVEAVALSRLLPPGTGRLLELGAGAGRNTLRYRGFDEIVLLDYSRSQLAQARDRLGDGGGRYRFVAADIYRLPLAPAAFQAATMIRTLHHMAEPAQALAGIRPLLVQGGTFVLEYANKRNLKAILRWLAGRQDWSPFSGQSVEFASLNFDFHPRAVLGWLEQAGFAPGRQLTVSHFRLGLLKRLVPTGWLVAMDAAAQWTGGWWQLSPSVFVQATAVGDGPEPFDGALWRCPVCASLDLRQVAEGLHCHGCGRRWAERDGILDFKEPLEAGS